VLPKVIVFGTGFGTPKTGNFGNSLQVTETGSSVSVSGVLESLISDIMNLQPKHII
jgi:hypothetical protein